MNSLLLFKINQERQALNEISLLVKIKDYCITFEFIQKPRSNYENFIDHRITALITFCYKCTILQRPKTNECWNPNEQTAKPNVYANATTAASFTLQ